jgi:hypothetical protein
MLVMVLAACTLPDTLISHNAPTATRACMGQTGQILMTVPSTAVRVGEPVTISMTLYNTTCAGMGLLLFRLEPDPETAFEPFEPISYPSGVPGGGSHTVEFKLIPTQPDEVSLSGGVSFEGVSADGAFYWGAVRSETPLVLTIVE